jgi:hypothetical protein
MTIISTALLSKSFWESSNLVVLGDSIGVSFCFLFSFYLCILLVILCVVIISSAGAGARLECCKEVGRGT